MKTTAHHRVTPDLAERVRGFVSGLDEAHGACQELDPRWLIALRQGLRHDPRLLIAEQDGCIAGVLPLALVRSVLFGRFVVSLPYLNRAGIAWSEPQAADALWTTAADVATQTRAKHLELRHHAYLHTPDEPIEQRSDKSRMVLALPDDVDTLWSDLNAKVRNQVRKGEKNALEITFGGAELLGDFHRIFSINMRDLGTPVYPRRMFAAILDAFGSAAELAVVQHNGSAVAGALLIHDEWTSQQTSQVPSASCLRCANAISANMWMYHQLLKRAVGRGSRQFDFGRSSEGSGTWRFKQQWGAMPQATVWQTLSREAQPVALRPDNPKFQRRIETWQKLPVWVTRALGPAVVRGIP